jgi:hypothetical protein
MMNAFGTLNSIGKKLGTLIGTKMPDLTQTFNIYNKSNDEILMIIYDDNSNWKDVRDILILFNRIIIKDNEKINKFVMTCLVYLAERILKVSYDANIETNKNLASLNEDKFKPEEILEIKQKNRSAVIERICLYKSRANDLSLLAQLILEIFYKMILCRGDNEHIKFQMKCLLSDPCLIMDEGKKKYKISYSVQKIDFVLIETDTVIETLLKIVISKELTKLEKKEIINLYSNKYLHHVFEHFNSSGLTESLLIKDRYDYYFDKLASIKGELKLIPEDWKIELHFTTKFIERLRYDIYCYLTKNFTFDSAPGIVIGKALNESIKLDEKLREIGINESVSNIFKPYFSSYVHYVGVLLDNKIAEYKSKMSDDLHVSIFFKCLRDYIDATLYLDNSHQFMIFYGILESKIKDFSNIISQSDILKNINHICDVVYFTNKIAEYLSGKVDPLFIEDIQMVSFISDLNRNLEEGVKKLVFIMVSSY